MPRKQVNSTRKPATDVYAKVESERKKEADKPSRGKKSS